jgi:DNA-binding transcriptional LysR family regulator
MTLTQLGAFVLVARLGSVRAAADVLGVSEPAVSRALAALRLHLGDQLVSRDGNGMRLTEGGTRLFGIASQMVSLGAEAETAVRAARGAPARLRLVATSLIAEFIGPPLVEAFARRCAGAFETTVGVASAEQMRVLLASRLADVALGPELAAGGRGAATGTATGTETVSEPVLRYRMIVVGSPRSHPHGVPSRWPWLVDPSGTDPGSETGRLLRALRVPDRRIRVFPNQTAAWAAAADGGGVAPAVASLVAGQLRRGELRVVETESTPVTGSWYVTMAVPERRGEAARHLRTFLATPEATRLMCAPGTGVPPSRFRPPVHVTIWS